VGSKNYHPQELATFASFQRLPEEVWAWYLYRLGVCRKASPNPSHTALVELENKLGDDFLLITQNVDGLHSRAGNSAARTYPIHGNIEQVRCSASCTATCFPIPEAVRPKQKGEGLSEEEARWLKCRNCGARLRPHVLWFDECYDEEHFRFRSSLEAAARCSTLISVGSSGSTNLPAQVAAVAARGQALLVDINPEPNPFAELACRAGGTWLRGSASQVLPEIVARVHARS